MLPFAPLFFLKKMQNFLPKTPFPISNLNRIFAACLENI